MYSETNDNGTAHPPGQGARLLSDGTPALGPIVLDANWLARQNGWDSEAERQRVRLLLIREGAVIVTNREHVSDPCCGWTDIEDGLRDRYYAGLLPVPDRVYSYVALALIGDVSRRVWRNVLDAQEREAWEARRAEMFAEHFEEAA